MTQQMFRKGNEWLPVPHDMRRMTREETIRVQTHPMVKDLRQSFAHMYRCLRAEDSALARRVYKIMYAHEQEPLIPIHMPTGEYHA